MKRKIHEPTVLCDIDHVISDAFWRDGMLTGADIDYDAYHLAGKHDKPHTEVVRLLQTLHLSKQYFIVGLTARPEKWRKQTMDWMIQHEVPMHSIIMRPNDRMYDPSPKLKVEMIKHHYGDCLDVIQFVIDDRDDVVAAVKAMNLNVIQYHMKRSDNV